MDITAPISVIGGSFKKKLQFFGGIFSFFFYKFLAAEEARSDNASKLTLVWPESRAAQFGPSRFLSLLF
jgi:hypothetical protein